jgi:ABC-type sugar transport system permease subunit
MSIVMRRKLIRICGIGFIILIISYLFPTLKGLFDTHLDIFTSDQDGFNEAWERSIIFAFVSTIFNVILGLLFAIGLRRITILSNKGKILGILLLPVILGNVSVAFVGKLLFSDASIFHQSANAKFLTLLFIQFWQFGSLYVYLFWLNIQNIPQRIWDYTNAIQMTEWEIIKDVIVPSCRNLSALLLVLNFIFSVYEDAKIQLIFKTSQGTHTELISQWLSRSYQSLSLLNPNLAIQQILQISWIVLGLTLVSILLTNIGYSFFFNKISISRRNLKIRKWIEQPVFLWCILLVFVIFPLIYVFIHTAFNLQMSFSHLILPFIFTLLAALCATFLSIFLGILLRLGWKKTLSTFDKKSLVFFIFLFFLQLIPPIALLIVGFQWLKIIGYQSKYTLYIVWITGHTILSLPLLSSFITTTHFRTKNIELDYLESYKLSFSEIVRDSFLKRFKADYLLTLLVAFSMIWNEATINNLLSDFIPSFVSEMKMSITGRATDYAKGISYLSVSLAIGFLALNIWRIILNKASKQ